KRYVLLYACLVHSLPPLALGRGGASATAPIYPRVVLSSPPTRALWLEAAGMREPAQEAQMGYLTRAKEIALLLVAIVQGLQRAPFARGKHGRHVRGRCLRGHGSHPLSLAGTCCRYSDEQSRRSRQRYTCPSRHRYWPCGMGSH